ncbi:hypothetical protein EYC84_008625 [Monilinia fructicola]|uniref:Uncharacterized protein n=1 Tax=Monilinia fructicola TaxID=38448 RepID=A0A5M9JMH8_MONFR|nr:hypothetical protein EYC84_008625 [Monilinia fructicola]
MIRKHPHVMGSRHEGSVHCSIGSPQLTGGPSLGAQMGYVDSPLGSPEIGDGSIYKGGVRSSVYVADFSSCTESAW